MTLAKRRIGMLEALRAPLSKSYFPVCMTCGRHCDSVGIVEEHKTSIKVLAKHHGAEQLVTLDLGTEHWDDRDVTNALRGVDFFNPRGHFE